MFPSEVENAACVGLESVLIPRTWVAFSSNAELSWRNEETWFVHPPVKLAGWNPTTTTFPRKSESVMLPRWVFKVKSGAGMPG